ncbi:alkaline phosphatase family protein [Lapidilactobacillus bayanensis]|uniref:alkaline phosphatase family protein n=1 Tax=Lapidilactobacillus bayanensis TaxID=2485998 RepID=UPI0013DDF35D|nr:alkaline phosphatase family protein [Lapidilactobacillus bayanensis]
MKTKRYNFLLLVLSFFAVTSMMALPMNWQNIIGHTARLSFIQTFAWIEPIVLSFMALLIGRYQNIFITEYKSLSYYLKILGIFFSLSLFYLALNVTVVTSLFTMSKLTTIISYLYQPSNPIFSLFWLLMLSPAYLQLIKHLKDSVKVTASLILLSVGTLITLLVLFTHDHLSLINYAWFFWLMLIMTFGSIMNSSLLTTCRNVSQRGLQIVFLVSIVGVFVGLFLGRYFSLKHNLPISNFFSIHPFGLLNLVLLILFSLVVPKSETSLTAFQLVNKFILPFIAIFVFGNMWYGVSNDWWVRVAKLQRVLTLPVNSAVLWLVFRILLTFIFLTVVTYIWQKGFENIGAHHWNSSWINTILVAIIVPCSFFVLQLSTISFRFGVLQRMDRFWIYLVNILILLTLYFVILAVVNRYYIALGIYILLMGVISFANYQKVILRNEPIVPLDVKNVVILPELIKMADITLPQIVIGLVALILVIALLIVFQHLLGAKKALHIPTRVILLTVAALNLGFWINFLPKLAVTWSTDNATHVASTNPIMMKLHYININLIQPQAHYNNNGSALGFLSMVKVEIMDEPSGYSENAMKKIATKYQKNAVKINRQRSEKIGDQTVIYVLSESLANPARVPGVTLGKDPIPYITQLQNKSGGLLDSLGYGGGTANIEFETLTSLSMNNFSSSLSIPYLSLVPKVDFLPTIMQDFKQKNAIHPYTGLTYQRNDAFKKFGFQNFYTLTNGTKTVKYQSKLGKSPYVDDQSSFNEVLSLLKQHKQGQFIQLSTMQNHTPFLSSYYSKSWPIKSNLTASAEASLKAYTVGINYTDNEVQNFIKKIDQMKRHVTVVFYGDHLPGIYNWRENNSAKLQRYDNILHQSDYFIYSNFKTKKVSKAVASPNMLTPLMLEKTNSKVSPYYALLTQLATQTPAIERDKYMGDDGKYLSASKLTKTQKQILNDYELVQYDVSAGHNYLKNDSFYETK